MTPESHSTDVATPAWQEIEQIVDTVHAQIQRGTVGGYPNCIVAVSRGGLIPGVMLSHRLGVDMLLTLQIRSTVADSVNSQKVPPLINGDDGSLFAASGKRVLLVDDIFGTGRSHELAYNTICKYHPQTLRSVVLYRNHSQVARTTLLPTVVGAETRSWIKFPWETDK